MKINMSEVVAIDFETYYDPKYSLRSKAYNLSHYIMDEKFLIHCCAIKIGNGKSKCYPREAAIKKLKEIDWSKHDLLAHNNFFDGAIMAWHLGITPRRYFCTLQMTRGLHSDMSRARLDDIAQFYGIGAKTAGLEDVKGLRELPPDKLKKLMEYCNNDNELCFEIFKKQIAVFPEKEIDLIDLTIEMFTKPVFQLDVARAEKSLNYEMNERLKFIAISGQDEKTLKSTAKFVEALEDVGVDAPKKVSKYNGEVTYALSETDLEFMALQEHEDIRVVRLVQGRLAAKSTMMETRAFRMIEAQQDCGGLPVLLNYYGAKTGRWSGGNKMNFQNLPTASKDFPLAGELRYAIIAPPGHVIIAPDSAQIEARVVAWVAGHEELLVKFRKKEDVYRWMAGLIYGKDPKDITDEERFIGKIAVLGLGYGMGAKRFQTTLALGVMGPVMLLTLAECKRIVVMYRKLNKTVVDFWATCEDVLRQMCRKQQGFFGPDDCLEYDGTDIWLPNGMALHYPGLEATENGFRYMSNGVRKHIYGGLLCENIVQALAGVVIREEMVEVRALYKRTKLKKGEIARIATMTHDEIVSVVPERIATKMLDENLKIMRKEPSWGVGLPINAAAEKGFAKNYSV